jgi:hypothetical protein
MGVSVIVQSQRGQTALSTAVVEVMGGGCAV